MKKWLCIATVIAILFTLSACGKKNDSDNNVAENQSTSIIQQQDLAATDIFGNMLMGEYSLTTSDNTEDTFNQKGECSGNLLKEVEAYQVEDTYDIIGKFTNTLAVNETLTITPKTKIADIENMRLPYHNAKILTRKFGVAYGDFSTSAASRYFASISFTQKNKMKINGNKGCFNFSHNPDVNYAKNHYPNQDIIAVEIAGITETETDISFSYNEADKTFIIEGNNGISNVRTSVKTTEETVTTNWGGTYGVKKITITLDEKGMAYFEYEAEE